MSVWISIHIWKSLTEKCSLTMFAQKPTQKSDPLHFHFVLFGDVFPSVWAEEVSHGTTIVWKLTSRYESTCDSYQEKNNHPHNSISLYSHPAWKKYEWKPVLLVDRCFWLLRAVTFLCVSLWAFSHLFLKIQKLSPVSCVQRARWIQKLPRRGLGGTPLLWPLHRATV